MKIWMHKKTGELFLSYQAYVLCSMEIEGKIISKPTYLAEALQRQDLATSLYTTAIYKDFEYIGEL